MTKRQKALTALLAAAAAGGGFVGRDDAVRIIRETCAPTSVLVEHVTATGTRETRVDFKTAAGWAIKLCDPENTVPLADQVELQLTKGGTP